MTQCEIEGYERLRTVVVRQVVGEYRGALKKSARKGETCQEQGSLEKWFLSPWGQTLSGDNGKLIIELCKREMERKHKKAVRK